MNEKAEQQETKPVSEGVTRKLAVEERRDALKKLGKYAAYAAPALLGMTSGAKAQAFSQPAG